MAAFMPSGMTLEAAPWTFVFTEPATTFCSPFIRASKPCLATCAGSSFELAPTLVSSISARWKKLVSVGPGMSAVIVTPVSASSVRSASAKDCTKDLEALYTAWYVPGIMDAIDDVNSTRPAPRAFMSGRMRFARCTVEVTLTSMTFSSSLSSVWVVKSPPMPRPALIAMASTGRPASRMAAYNCSTPSYVARSTCTGMTSFCPSRRRSVAAWWIPVSSAAISRSKPFSANCFASSYPIPLEAPVTTAKVMSLGFPAIGRLILEYSIRRRAWLTHESSDLARDCEGVRRDRAGSGASGTDRCDRPDDLHGDLRIGSAPVRRPRHVHRPRRHPGSRADGHRRGGRRGGHPHQAWRPGGDPVQHLVRPLLDVQPRLLRPVRDHPEQGAEQGRLAVRLHQAVRAGARRPGRVPAGAAGALRPDQGAGRPPRRALPLPLRRPDHLLAGRQVGGHRRGRHGRGHRPRPDRSDVRPDRPPPGRRPRDRDRQRARAAGDGRAQRRRGAELRHRRRRTRGDPRPDARARRGQ